MKICVVGGTGNISLSFTKLLIELGHEVTCYNRGQSIFGHNTIYSAERLYRDVPEFQPRVGLEEGIRRHIEILDRDGRIPNSDDIEWEDRIIEAQRQAGKVKLS